MKKMELILLIVIPVLIFSVSFFGVYQVHAVHKSHEKNISNIELADNIISKIESESAERTQANLINYVKNTKFLLLTEQKSVTIYISLMRTFFNQILIVSIIWIVLVVVIFYRSNKRNNITN